MKQLSLIHILPAGRQIFRSYGQYRRERRSAQLFDEHIAGRSRRRAAKERISHEPASTAAQHACGGSCYHPGQQRNKLDRRCRALRTSDSRADFRIITTNKTKQEKRFVTENSGHNMKRKIVYGLLCMLLVGITACTCLLYTSPEIFILV